MSVTSILNSFFLIVTLVLLNSRRYIPVNIVFSNHSSQLVSSYFCSRCIVKSKLYLISSGVSELKELTELHCLLTTGSLFEIQQDKVRL